jgi:hypothetical protein
MLNRTSAFLITATAALGLAGCGSSGYVPKKQPEVAPLSEAGLTADVLLPLKPGSAWTYRVDTIIQNRSGVQPETGVMELRVAKYVKNGDVTKATLEFVRDKKVVDEQEWRIDKTGIYQISSGTTRTKFSSPVPFLITPLVKDKITRWNGTGYTVLQKVGKISSSLRLRGPEVVDTSLGKKSGIAVETLTEFTVGTVKGNTVSTTWFEPKVGIIRLRQAVTLPTGSVTTTLSLSKAPL